MAFGDGVVVGVGSGAAVGVGIGVDVGDGVDVGIAVGLGEGFGVIIIGLGVGVGVAVGVGVGLSVGVAVMEGVEMGEGDEVSVGGSKVAYRFDVGFGFMPGKCRELVDVVECIIGVGPGVGVGVPVSIRRFKSIAVEFLTGSGVIPWAAVTIKIDTILTTNNRLMKKTAGFLRFLKLI